MNKGLKILISITIIILAVILIFPNIIKQEYSAHIEAEDKIESIKENIPRNEDKAQETDAENSFKDEEKEDKPQEAEIKYTIDNLNMRTGPSTAYERILTIPIAKEVIVIGQKDGWDQITYNDHTGFASANYLTKSKEEADKALENKKKKEEADKALENKKSKEEEQVEKSQNSAKPQEAVETMKIVKNILLVNKTYGLPSNYNPGEDPTAVAHLNKMIKGAQEEIGKKIMSVSGFRSYNYQKGLYARYVKRDGEKKASMYSARPGHSEHQTGLAFDIGGVDKQHWVTSSFENTEEARWLKDNAHRYGFILRYPKGKTDITGYKFEPWHFRYIGIEDATRVYEKQLTLEEYLF